MCLIRFLSRHFLILMKRGLAQEEIANEAPNHLAGRQTSPPRLSFQGHGLLTR